MLKKIASFTMNPMSGVAYGLLLAAALALSACGAHNKPPQARRVAPPVALDGAKPAAAGDATQVAQPAAANVVRHLPLFVKQATVSMPAFVAALDPTAGSRLFNAGVNWKLYVDRFAQLGAPVGDSYDSFAAFMLSNKIVLKKLMAGEAANSGEYSIRNVDLSWIGSDGKTVGYFHRSQPYAGEMIAGYVNSHGRFVPLVSLGCGNMARELFVPPPIAAPVCVRDCDRSRADDQERAVPPRRLRA